jgi:hypothetical protein
MRSRLDFPATDLVMVREMLVAESFSLVFSCGSNQCYISHRQV